MSNNAIEPAVRRLFWAAASAAAAILVAGSIGDFLRWEGFPAKLRLDRELGVPAWYSSLLMFSAGALAASIAASERHQALRARTGWWALAVLFVYFSADEMVSFHEGFADGLKGLPSIAAMRNFRWLVVGIPVVAIVGALFLPFLLHLPRRTAIWLAAGGVVFLAGAVGMEILGGMAFVLAGERRTFLYIAFATIEEALEYTGVLVTIYGMLTHRAAPSATAQPFATAAANASNSG